MAVMEFCCRLPGKRVGALLMLSFCIVSCNVEATKQPAEVIGWVAPHSFSIDKNKFEGRSLALVEPPPLVLTYHKGPLITKGPVIRVYVLWYGTFSSAQRATLLDFFGSFRLNISIKTPSVGSWWKLTSGYKNTKGVPVAQSMRVAGQITFPAKKKALSTSNIQSLVVRSLKKLPANSNAIYVVFTAADVEVESFCMDSCASHFASNETLTKGQSLPYIWVGNPGVQCPGLCAWPYAKPEYGPPNFIPLLPPNFDVGIDGLIINLASMLAGIVTNPFDTGYYQGDAGAPLEAATACQGVYGANAYPGYPGDLLKDSKTNVSYNTNGVHDRTFLMPALWNPATSLCTP